jgi:type I restriction enzyme, S subunit
MSAAVRAGYKLTEIGVIPKDWEVDRLDSFWSVTDCKHVTAQFISNGYPLASIKEVQSRFVDLTDSKQTTQQFYDRLIEGGRKPMVGDLIISRNATVGEVAQVAEWHPLFAMGQDVCLIRKRKIEFSSDYLQSVFYSHIVKNQLSDAMVGSTFKRINVQQIKSFTVPMPDVSEQRAIAAALSDVDALLAKQGQLIAKKQGLKQAAMQQLLTGQTRLPGFSGDWELKPMKSLGNTYGGLTGKTKIDFGHGRARYIPFMNVMTDTVIDTEWFEAVNVSLNEAQKLTQKGDLFFNGSSESPEEVGFCSVLLQDIPNLYLNSFCFGFRFNIDAKVYGLFFAYWFRSAKGRKEMAVLAQGATRYNIAKSAFLKLELPQPSEAEQTAIATILSDMDTEIAALEERQTKTRALKQGMMQELLTGRTRLV